MDFRPVGKGQAGKGEELRVQHRTARPERGGYRGGQDYGLRAGGHETQAGREDAHIGGILRDGGRGQAGGGHGTVHRTVTGYGLSKQRHIQP